MTTNRRDRYRMPTPKELGSMVSGLRRFHEWSQLALAATAGVTERTIQRLESGKGASEATLRSVAKAFGLEQDRLLRPVDLSWTEDFPARYARWREATLDIECREIASLHDCEAVLGAEAYMVDDSNTEDQSAEAVASLRDLIASWFDVFKEADEVTRLKVKQDLFASVKEIEQRGNRILFAVHRTEDEIRINMVYVVIVTSSGRLNPKFLIVPRKVLTAAPTLS